MRVIECERVDMRVRVCERMSVKMTALGDKARENECERKSKCVSVSKGGRVLR